MSEQPAPYRPNPTLKRLESGFDSLILVAPAVFHYVHYFVGVGDEFPRVFTG